MLGVIALRNIGIGANDTVLDVFTNFVNDHRFHEYRFGHRAINDDAIVVDRSKRTNRTVGDIDIVANIKRSLEVRVGDGAVFADSDTTVTLTVLSNSEPILVLVFKSSR